MDKPEALFLADELEAPLGTVIGAELYRRAAEELRRLHAENERIRSALNGWIRENSPGGWIDDLRTQREPVEWDAWLMWGIVLLLLAVVIIAPMLEVAG